MPPKKKRKGLKNVPSDADSGGPSDSDSHKDSAKGQRKAAAATPLPPPATTSSSSTSSSTTTTTTTTQDRQNKPHQQIKGFVSQQELAKHAITLKLKRVMLADLHQQSDLTGGYIGGQVMGHCSLPACSGQGHDLHIFIQDESTSEGSQSKHLKVIICNDLAEKMPVLDDAKLFLYKPTVQDDIIEVSQDHGKSLLVDGVETHVWIVHKNVRKPSFFSEKSCGKKWWGRTKKRREKIQAMWSAESASVGGNLKEPSMAGPSAAPSTDQNAAAVDDSLSQSSTFPDNSDFPDSAFNDHNGSDDTSMPSDSSSNASEDSDREWTERQQQNTAATGRAYVYKKLADLKIGDMKVNVIGMVKEFKPPALTRGSDYYSTLTLLDESDPNVGIKCIIFNKNPEKHPQLKRVGDIACLHRVNVVGYSGMTQLQGLRYCSANRFSGYAGRKLSPTTGSVSFTCSLVERRRVMALREWARSQRREKLLKTLESVGPGMYFDLTCQIVSVTVSKVPKCVVLAVWDGGPHTINCRKLSLEKWYDEGYPIVKDDDELSEDSHGYQTDIVVYNKKCMRKASELVPRQFVYLQGLYSTKVSGNLLEINMKREDEQLLDSQPARIEILSRHDPLFKGLEERIERAMTVITTTRHHRQPLCTVAEIAGHTQPLPAKFHCRARVLRVDTPTMEEMVLVHCRECNRTEYASEAKKMDPDGLATEPCPNCVRLGRDVARSPRPACLFYFKMTVGDRSGQLEVEVANDEAVYLFNNLKPNNLYQYQEVRYSLMQKLYHLTGGNTPFGGDDASAGGAASSQVIRPRPWADFCILAAEHNKKIYYCLLDTKLKQS